MGQDLRSFVGAYERAFPAEVVRVAEPVSIEYDVMAVVLEYERRRRYPILLFERVTGHDIPIVCNVVASRPALAFALGVPERQLAAEYARRIKDPIKPVATSDPPFRARRVSGDAVDLGALPIPTYFPGDAGRYLTAGMLVARDPDTGVETEGYHRFQVKSRNRMGVSLHSRRRMFEYQ
ncbi:MAG: UbiD family decarboxylase domain-containing protein, partial [Candidatus Rokuibacteriota bacterium]